MNIIATIAELLVKISGDSSGLRKEIAASQRQLKRGFGADALDVSEGATGLLAGLAAAMGAVGAAAIKMSADFSASKTAFTQLLGSADKAESMLKDLTTFAADTPFEMPGLVNATKRLLGMGFAAEDVIPMMSAIGDSIALLGGGQDAINGVVRALGQIQAKGKLSAEEINQLSDNNIQAWKYVASELGVSIPQAMQMTKDGAVDASTAINGIIKGLQTEFKGGMSALSQEIPGLLSTIKDNAGMVLRGIGDQLIETFNIKGILQDVANTLTQFSSAISSVGIKQAIQGLVPPEAIAAVFALSGAIIAAAIPAMYAFAVSAWAAIVPLAPFIAAGAAVGALAYEIWNNWEPLSELFGSLWSTISQLFSDYWSIITDVVYDSVGGAVDYITEGWNSISDATNTIWSGITGFISDAWEGIKSIVASGVNWIIGAMQPLLNLVSSVLPAGVRNLFSNLSAGIGKVTAAAGKLRLGGTDIAGMIPQANKPNTTFTGLHSAGVTSGSLSDAKTKKSDAEKEWEKLEKAADRVSKSIEDEWTKLTKTHLEQLDKWRDDQLKELNESAAANENYQRDLTRLDEIYAEKRKKILYDQQKETNSIWDSALSYARNLQERFKSIGLFGVEKQKFDIESDATKQLTDLENKYRDMSLEFTNADEEHKTQMIKAWQAAGYQFEKMSNGTINFAKQAANERVLIEKEAQQKIQDLHYDTEKFKNNLSEAYDDGNLSAYMEELDSERGALYQDLTGRQSMIDAYYDAWKASHRTAMEDMAEASHNFQDGLGDMFSTIFQDINNAGDAVKDFGKLVIKTIADIAAKRLAGSITESLLGSFLGSGVNLSGSAPAGVLGPVGSNGGFYLNKADGGYTGNSGSRTVDHIPSLLTAGEFVMNSDATSSIGVGNLNYMNDTGNLPGFATGGLVTGPSLSSLSDGYGASAIRPGGGTGGVNIVVNNNSSAKVTATDGGIMDGIRQIVIEIAPDAVLDKASRNSSYARNFNAALGGA